MSQNSRVDRTLIAYLRRELCTPINAMMGYSAMLLEVQAEAQTNLIADLHKIHDCSQQLSTLVNALLDSAQLELSQIDGDLHRFGSTLRMEILTPLSTIVGYCKMLLEKAPAEAVADLDKINTAARQLLNLVNDIVHLARQQLPMLTAPESVSQLAIEHSAAANITHGTTDTLALLDWESPTPPIRDGTILAIDDNPTNCDSLARQLRQQGYLVTTATNAQALRLLKASPFDLITIDAIGLGIDGLEMLRQLKQDESCKHIPAIVFSALGEIESAVKWMKLGAADYVQKPFDLTLLKAKIGVYLEHNQLQDRQSNEQPVHQTAAIDMSNRSYNLEDLVQSPSKLTQIALAANPIGSQPPPPASPAAALERLLAGNQRFVDEACQNPQRSRSRIQEIASDQYPFASILGCADSRVPAEIVFDQGLGDLFVIRVAGNIASQTAIGSLEFATLVLGTQLIVVVGHSGCGAVAAAIKGEPLPGRISSIVEEIKPAIARAKDKIGDLTENTVIANIQRQAKKLMESSILADSIQAGKLKIVGGQYDLQTGKFTLVT